MYHKDMTCVIALKTKNNTVILGGDSFCGDEEVVDICKAPKVYKMGPIGVGICGSIRPEQILEKIIKREVINNKNNKITEDWLKNDFIEILTEEMGEISNNYEDYYNFILTLEGKIFILDKTLSLWDTGREYTAIGSGRTFALGALHYATTHNKNEEPKKMVLNALQAAEELSPQVRGPFTIIEAFKK